VLVWLLGHMKVPGAASEARWLRHRELAVAVAASAGALQPSKETRPLRTRR
jgi:hypothetical protein